MTKLILTSSRRISNLLFNGSAKYGLRSIYIYIVFKNVFAVKNQCLITMDLHME